MAYEFRGHDADGLAVYSEPADKGHAIPAPPAERRSLLSYSVIRADQSWTVVFGDGSRVNGRAASRTAAVAAVAAARNATLGAEA